MRVSFIGHASILIDTGTVRILSDPWWRGPCFGAQWWIYPSPRTDLVSYDNVDYIYISHGHHDHYHPGTLKLFDRKTKVLVSRELDLADSIRSLGFDVIEVDAVQPIHLSADCRCWIWPTYGGDSLSVIECQGEVSVNANDALHAAPIEVRESAIRRLRDAFPRIDYLFCGYGVASHFPNCYVIPGKDDQRTAAKRQHYFNAIWAGIVDQLQPVFGFPFAADVVFLEADLQHVNEPTHNSERPTALLKNMFPDSKVRTIDIAPGFVVENGQVVSLVERQPLSIAALRQSQHKSIERANRYARVDAAKVDHVASLLQANTEVCRPYLIEHRGDYSFLIAFRNSNAGVSITKKGDRFDVVPIHDGVDAHRNHNVRYLTRLPYLELSLSKRYADEILFVGSGGVFSFRSEDDARRNLHLELRAMLRKHEQSPPSRFGHSRPIVARLKQFVRTLLRIRRDDLYDLMQWVEWEQNPHRSTKSR